MKKDQNQTLGRLGEAIAAKYLDACGYRILEQNFKKRYGEIDIVALDKETLVFIEVKTRRGNKFGPPEESITWWKLRSLLHSVNYYKLLHPNLPKAMRIDVVGVALSPFGTIEKITLYRNITG